MTDNQPPLAAAPSPYARWSRYCVVTLYVLVAVWGGVQIALPDATGLFFMFSLLFAAFATLWAKCDSSARGKPILPVLLLLYFLAWPIGATIYLIFRSGWRGLAAAILHGICLFSLMAIAVYATVYGLHFVGLIDQRFYQPM